MIEGIFSDKLQEIRTAVRDLTDNKCDMMLEFNREVRESDPCSDINYLTGETGEGRLVVIARISDPSVTIHNMMIAILTASIYAITWYDKTIRNDMGVNEFVEYLFDLSEKFGFECTCMDSTVAFQSAELASYKHDLFDRLNIIDFDPMMTAPDIDILQ